MTHTPSLRDDLLLTFAVSRLPSYSSKLAGIKLIGLILICL